MTKSRKPNRFEMTFLMMWHGVLTSSVLLTYISGDDIYFLHQFAGYVVCGAILVRLLAAALAPKNSPLYLSLPKLFAHREGGRSPLLAWIAVALITATTLAAFSGLLAESIGFDDLHEGLANGVLPVVIFVHMAVVLWKPLARRLSSLSAQDVDRTVAQASAAATTLTAHAVSAVRRAKPYLQSHK
jgi:hypothetical protein